MPANPYIGAAENASSAASHVGAALLHAAQQQQHLQQQQRQQDLKDQFETELKLRKGGYTPLMTTTSQESSGLKRREPQQVDPSRVITDHHGRQWVSPPPKPDATPQQTFADTRGLLDSGADPVQGGTIYRPGGMRQEMEAAASLPSAHMPVPDSSRVVSVPGGGQFYISTPDEKAAQSTRAAVARDEAVQASRGFTLSDKLAAEAEQRFGLPPGTLRGKLPREAAGTVFNHLTTPSRQGADKPEAFHYTVGDEGKVTRIGSDGVPRTWNGKEWATAGTAIGKRGKGDSDGTPQMSAANRRRITADKAAALRKAEEGLRKWMGSGKNDAARLRATNKSREDAVAELNQAKQAAQDTYEESIASLTGASPGHFDYSQQQAPAPAAPPAQVTEGTIIRNPQTKERLMLKGGQWVPAP